MAEKTNVGGAVFVADNASMCKVVKLISKLELFTCRFSNIKMCCLGDQLMFGDTLMQ